MAVLIFFVHSSLFLSGISVRRSYCLTHIAADINTFSAALQKFQFLTIAISQYRTLRSYEGSVDHEIRPSHPAGSIQKAAFPYHGLIAACGRTTLLRSRSSLSLIPRGARRHFGTGAWWQRVSQCREVLRLFSL